MEEMCWVLAGVIGSLAIPALTSVFVEGAWRSQWHLEDVRKDALKLDGQGVFREATVHATVAAVPREQAPGWLRLMAFSCWFLGQMVIPGFLAWCLGLLMFGQLQGGDRLVGSVMMTAFFPGVWCAWLLWRAGSSLVRGERHRADRATRRAVVVIVTYNVAVIVASGVWIWFHRHDEVLWGCVAYAMLSIVHVIAVRATFLAHREEFPVEHAEI